MADLAQMKYLADSLFPPCSFPFSFMQDYLFMFIICQVRSILLFKLNYSCGILLTQNIGGNDDSTKDEMKLTNMMKTVLSAGVWVT